MLKFIELEEYKNIDFIWHPSFMENLSLLHTIFFIDIFYGNKFCKIIGIVEYQCMTLILNSMIFPRV
jgi:hypothetical protein